MSTPEAPYEWTLDADARVRIDAEYARIEQLHEHMPRCVVCGQRCARFDEFGCCSKLSKLSEPHRIHRAELRPRVRS